MNDQEKQKLNEKLAKWVWPKPDYRVAKVFPKLIAIDKRYDPEATKALLSKGIKDKWHRVEHISLFTDSLETCFKWLIPKLKRWEAGNNKDGSVWFRCNNPKLDIHGIEYPIERTAETLPLAICLAIEKLIDAREKQ